MINDPETLPSRIEYANLKMSSKFSWIIFIFIFPCKIPFNLGKSLIGENEKKIISESLEIKTILPNNLEDELKKYYEI